MAPGGHVMTSAARARDAERQARGDALSHGHDVDIETKVLAREHPARSAHAGLHFVGDQQHAVPV
jgi:hypothetical protein